MNQLIAVAVLDAFTHTTQDRAIRAFIPAILLNLSLHHCDSLFLFRDLEVFGLVNDNSTTN